MTAARIKELLGLMLVGEGVVGTLYPQGHVDLWRGVGPRPFRDLVEWFAERPELLRALWAVQTGVGFWLAVRQLPSTGRALRERELAPAVAGG